MFFLCWISQISIAGSQVPNSLCYAAKPQSPGDGSGKAIGGFPCASPVMSLVCCSLVTLFRRGASVFCMKLPGLLLARWHGGGFCGGMEGVEPRQEPAGTGRGSLILGQPVLIPLSLGTALGMGSPPPHPQLAVSYEDIALIPGPVGASSRDGACFSKIIFYRESGSADVGER